MGLNCTGPLICGFFSIVNTTALHDLQLGEPPDVESWIWKNYGYRGTMIWRADFKLYMDFFTSQRVDAPNPCCSRVNCNLMCLKYLVHTQRS